MDQITTLPSAHSLLRRATQRRHMQIEGTSVLARLTSPGLTVNLYGIAMRAFQRAYEKIDFLLVQGAYLCPVTAPPYSPRGPLLERDLIALGVNPYNPLLTRPPAVLKAPETEADYLGMRYVVEGAQLGSRVIYSHLYAAFGDKLSEFGSFWMPDSIFPSSWPGVLKSLARVDSREALAGVARAARRTFRHMELYLAVEERPCDESNSGSLRRL